mgnify:FL=1
MLCIDITGLNVLLGLVLYFSGVATAFLVLLVAASKQKK